MALLAVIDNLKIVLLLVANRLQNKSLPSFCKRKEGYAVQTVQQM
jgi:hypothetical protein